MKVTFVQRRATEMDFVDMKPTTHKAEELEEALRRQGVDCTVDSRGASFRSAPDSETRAKVMLALAEVFGPRVELADGEAAQTPQQ